MLECLTFLEIGIAHATNLKQSHLRVKSLSAAWRCANLYATSVQNLLQPLFGVERQRGYVPVSQIFRAFALVTFCTGWD